MRRGGNPLDIKSGAPLLRLWLSASRLSPCVVLLLGGWIVVGGLAQVLAVLPSAHIVALIAERSPGEALHLRQLLLPVAAICALIALSGLARLAVHTYAYKLGRAFNGYMRAQVMRAVSSPPELTQIEDPAARARLDVAVGVGPNRYNPGGAIVRTSHRATFAVQVISGFVILCLNNLIAGVLVGVTVLACRRMFSRSIAAYAVELASDSGQFKRVDYLRGLLWSPSSARELRVFDMWQWLRAQLTHTWQAVEDRLRHHRRSARITIFVSAAVFTVGFGAGFATTFRAWSSGNMPVQAAVVSLQVMILLAVALSRIVVDADQSVELGVRAVPAAAELIRSADISTSGALRSAEPQLLTASLRCAGLSFAYPWGDRLPVLHDVTLDVGPGERLGIVGPNGAGKSTLIKLLCGFYRTEAGRLCIGGPDLNDLDRTTWQRSIAVVHQDFVRYPRSLLFNVALERDAEPGLAAECLAAVGLSGLIDRLGRGLEANLVIDGDLSGGQWQRVALARALYRLRTGARMLILDEPTANLDPGFEPVLSKLIAERAAGITTVIVSHRLSLVRDADQIAVFESGRIVELGTHAELLKASGLYSTMFRLQAAGWVDA